MRTCGICGCAAASSPCPFWTSRAMSGAGLPARRAVRFTRIAVAPAICHEYSCYWLDHEYLTDEFRPDRIGATLTECGTVQLGEDVLSILVLNQSAPERSAEADVLIEKMIARGVAVVVAYGTDTEIRFDQSRYPAITPHDIEVAFCYEQSQDRRGTDTTRRRIRRLSALDLGGSRGASSRSARRDLGHGRSVNSDANGVLYPSSLLSHPVCRNPARRHLAPFEGRDARQRFRGDLHQGIMGEKTLGGP